MNTLPAKELKRRGVAALEECLKSGPVHIIKNNRPACVVLREEEYQRLIPQGERPQRQRSVWAWLNKPSTGTAKRKDLDLRLKRERRSWETS